MPKLSFNPDKEDINKCENCRFSHKIISGNEIVYECFPVKEYSDKTNAINCCKKFFSTYKIKRDIYIVNLVYTLYPKFEHKLIQLGCIFRGVTASYDDIWKELKKSDYYERIKQELPKLGLNKNTLFEPIFAAERFYNEKEWRCITEVVDEEDIKEIMKELNNGNYDN